ncbi:aspartyl-tRNA synthetase [Lentinula detonsa]|uniref:Probable aspartate--tRNA ligase, cytoplasmic n=1 Tax=Lentinula detonsa TaxID=2804962 RepID=A0A9W8P0Q6_9AGAR|nr:aspartyl-tRNA synthetase [Lentinula detonsa]
MSPSLGISSKLNKLLSSRKREREPPETIDKEKERKSRDGHRTNSSTNSSPGKSPSPSPSPSTQPDQTILRVQLRRAESSQVAAMKESEEERNAYGEIDWDSDYEEQIQIQNISSHLNQTIHILARIHTIRAVSSSLVFIVFRQQLDTIQGVLSPTPPPPSSPTPHMIHWASRLNPETIVHVKAIVQKPNLPKGGERIEGTSVHDVELRILELHVLSRVAEPVPFTVYDADISAGAAGAEAEADNEYDGDKNTEDDFNNSDSQSQSHPNPLTPYIPDRSRIASRIIHLRSLTAQSTFRIQSTISTIFRTHLADLEYLNTTPLLEIHTPKLQGGASESGASVFKLKYFGRTAFLAQSPQLFKQMSIAADYGGVYEVGPVFRAENSNTKRHLTEYTGLDLEMMVRRDYHEVMLVVDSVLKAIFEEVYTKRRREVDVLKAQFPTPDLVWLPKTPVIAFADGIQMLIDSGWTDPSSQQPPLKNQDLSTRAEIQLGKLIKEKYNTDYYILDLFPKSARPFYTMPASTKLQKAMERKHGDSLGGLVTSSFDIFVRGQEITTGGQRIHDYGMLVDAMAENDISARGLEEYLDGFRWGAPPHGGAGIGLERLLMLVLGLNDIRNASMYPRDPKSLPEPPKALEGIRHPEADTLDQPRDWMGIISSPSPSSSFPPVPSLIANYGDAANTSWLDDRYLVWRDPKSGAAVGFVPSSSGFAIIVGDPLCDKSQTAGPKPDTTLAHSKPLPPLKPIWLLASSHLESVLGSRLGWSSFTCIAESRVELEGEVPGALDDKEVGRKIRKAESEGIEVGVWAGRDGFTPTQEQGKEIDDRIKEWREGRRKKGGQVRLTEVEVWRDSVHRQYFVALAPRKREGGEGKEEGGVDDKIPVALVVLHQLSPMYGFQVKYALDFPSSLSTPTTPTTGAIESALTTAMHSVASTGSGRLTFGTSATSRLTPTRGVGSGMRVKILGHAYEAIAERMALRGKGEFRKKMGAEEEDVYVCYPRGGLGTRGVKAVLDFCVAES